MKFAAVGISATLCLLASACATTEPKPRTEAAQAADAEPCAEATTGSRLRRCGSPGAGTVTRDDVDRAGLFRRPDAARQTQ